MLVLLGPSFEGSHESFQRLAEATGLVAYDLRSRIKPGWWGVIRAVGDPEQAEMMATRLRNEGFPVVAVDTQAAWNPERRIVKLQGAVLGNANVTLLVRDREMPIPYAAVLALVRGEVGSGSHIGAGPRITKSSSTFRAVVPASQDTQVPSRSLEGYQAADLHFHTAKWVGRVDARSFDFSMVPNATGHALRDLDIFVEELAQRAGIRVDKGAKMSSLAPYAVQGQHRITPAPGKPHDKPADPFDGYSRLVAEAELLAFRHQGAIP